MRFSGLRVGIILILLPLSLGVINQISLFIAPCNYLADTERQNYKENSSPDYECSYKDGIIVQGIFLFPQIRPEWWIALFTLTLWISTYKLWRASIEHVDIAKGRFSMSNGLMSLSRTFKWMASK
jgi:hypothetical protein